MMYRRRNLSVLSAEEKPILRIGCAAFILWALVAVGFWGAIIFVAVHFLKKVW